MVTVILKFNNRDIKFQKFLPYCNSLFCLKYPKKKPSISNTITFFDTMPTDLRK